MIAAGSERFPKSARLRSRQDYLRVQGQGAKVSVGPLLALITASPQGVTRLGITVSSKVGNAVTRARIRRHVREAFRKVRAQLPAGVDIVVVARGSAAQADSKALHKAFHGLLAKLPVPSR